MPTLKKIRAGLYEVVSVKCRCGGNLRIEKDSPNRGVSEKDFKWESFCIKCLSCDPNGWRTLGNAVDQLGYFK